jgi:hypothetical protein
MPPPAAFRLRDHRANAGQLACREDLTRRFARRIHQPNRY